MVTNTQENKQKCHFLCSIETCRPYIFVYEKRYSRSSFPKVFYKKGVFKNFTKFTGKYLCQSPFFNKVAGLRQKLIERCVNEHIYENVDGSLLQNHASCQTDYNFQHVLKA